MLPTSQVDYRAAAPFLQKAFPESTDNKRSFRTCTHVSLSRRHPSRSAGPSHLIVTNTHIVSGSKQNDHAVPGNTPMRRRVFKQTMLTAVARANVRLVDDFRRRDPEVVALIAGDMNMGRDDVREAIQNIDESSAVELCVHHASRDQLLQFQVQGGNKERGFIVSSNVGAVTTLSRDWL